MRGIGTLHRNPDENVEPDPLERSGRYELLIQSSHPSFIDELLRRAASDARLSSEELSRIQKAAEARRVTW